MTDNKHHHIGTERISLDPLRADDAAALYACRGDPEVARYQGWQPQSLEEASEFIARQAATVFGQTDTWCQRAIRLRETDALIGDLAVHFPADPAEAAELGISLTTAQQGHGYAREAMQGVIDHLFGVMGCRRIIASVDPRNAPCIQLLRAVGLRLEAHHRQSLYWRGAWVDDMIFAVLASEWSARKP